MIYEFGGYIQIIKDGNVTCTCIHGSFKINNYKNGDGLCRHIKRLMRHLYNGDKSKEKGVTSKVPKL